ncbi:MAG: hypothetical protein DCC75_03535, partial [Proteobacteria bacterium]
MSVYEFDQAAAVAGVKLMVNSLPATGKKLVFEHLIHMLSGKDIGALSPQAQAALLALIPQAPQGDSMSAKSAGRSAECYS